MSEYVNFYIKTPKSEFYSIMDICRSTYIYNACTSAPWLKVKKFTEKDLNSCLEYISDNRKTIEKSREKLSKKKEDILTIKNPNRDILDELNDIYEEEDELDYEEEELIHAEGFFATLSDILDCFKFRTEDKEKSAELWYGKESPLNITEKDMIEDE